MKNGDILLHEQVCTRCLHRWNSALIQPKQCPKCKSPYWCKPRIVRAEKVGYYWHDLQVGVEKILPWPLDGTGNVDRESADRRARSLEQYARRHNWEIYWKGSGKGLHITRKS